MKSAKLNILITGANGFIGKNLAIKLGEQCNEFTIYKYLRKNGISELRETIKKVDVVIHLAGENRPKNIKEYQNGNVELTKNLCDAIVAELTENGRKIDLIFTSSSHANEDNPYGRSKLQCEKIIQASPLSSLIIRPRLVISHKRS